MEGRRIGRNDPCPCGSGKKHKKCCLRSPSGFQKPQGVFGDGAAVDTMARPITKPRAKRGIERVAIDYTFDEPFGRAEATYCFPVGQLVALENDFVLRVERLKPGMRFKLEDGSIGLVTKAEPPKMWEPPSEMVHEGGLKERRVLGTIKHVGFMVLDLRIAGEVITTSPGHLFKSASRSQWVQANELYPGELLETDMGTTQLEAKGRIRYGQIELFNVEVEEFHTYFVGKEKGSAVMVHNGVPGAGGAGCGVTKAAAAEEAAVPPVAIPGGKPGDIHRIGGASVENLRLKPREAALDVPGISVIKAPTPGAAAQEMRTGLPRAKGLHEQAKTVGTASEEGIRSAGFDIIPTPSTALPNHHRIIHPDGVAGFNDTNLGRLAEVFRNTTGH